MSRNTRMKSGEHDGRKCGKHRVTPRVLRVRQGVHVGEGAEGVEAVADDVDDRKVEDGADLAEPLVGQDTAEDAHHVAEGREPVEDRLGLRLGVAQDVLEVLVENPLSAIVRKPLENLTKKKVELLNKKRPSHHSEEYEECVLGVGRLCPTGLLRIDSVACFSFHLFRLFAFWLIDMFVHLKLGYLLEMHVVF